MVDAWFQRSGARRTGEPLTQARRFLLSPSVVRRAMFIALGISLACGYLVDARAWMLSAALAVILCAGYSWPHLTLAGVSGTASFSKSRTCEGRPVMIELTLRNRCPWGACGLTLLPAGGPSDRPWAVVSCMPGWRTRRFRLEFVPELRGMYPQGGLLLTCAFPFGFTSASVPIEVRQPLIVWPRTWPIRLSRLSAGGSDESQACLPALTGSRDIFALRSYRRGDPLRSIHWKQTARHDRLIVCERQAPAGGGVTVILDVDPRHHRGHGREATLERAIRAAATLCTAWLEMGGRIGLVAGDRSIPPDAGSRQRRRLLDVLAGIPPEGLRCPPVIPCSPAFLVTTDRWAAEVHRALRLRQAIRLIALRWDPDGPVHEGGSDLAAVRRALGEF